MTASTNQGATTSADNRDPIFSPERAAPPGAKGPIWELGARQRGSAAAGLLLRCLGHAPVGGSRSPRPDQQSDPRRIMTLHLGIDVACRETHRASLTDDTGRLLWSNRRFITSSKDLTALWAAVRAVDSGRRSYGRTRADPQRLGAVGRLAPRPGRPGRTGAC